MGVATGDGEVCVGGSNFLTGPVKPEEKEGYNIVAIMFFGLVVYSVALIAVGCWLARPIRKSVREQGVQAHVLETELAIIELLTIESIRAELRVYHAATLGTKSELAQRLALFRKGHNQAA